MLGCLQFLMRPFFFFWTHFATACGLGMRPPQSRSLFLKSFLGLTSRVSIKCSPDWLFQLHSSIPYLNYVCVFVLAGSDGSSAGGQPAGRQHHAEDGSTLLLCTLAPLQRQVRYLHRFQSQHTFLHPAVLCRVRLHTCHCLSCQFVPLQAPVRRRAVRFGWEAGA